MHDLFLGLISGTSADGITVVEQWDSQDAYRAHSERPGVRRVLTASGLPEASTVVLDVFSPSRQLAPLARAC